MEDFHFLYNLKIVAFFSSLTTLTPKFRFRLRDTFFHCLIPFSGFSFQLNPHSEDLFLILGNARFDYRFYICGLLLPSRASQDSIDTSFSKSFISSSVICELQKSVVPRKIHLTLSSLNKTFTYSHKNTKHS